MRENPKGFSLDCHHLQNPVEIGEIDEESPSNVRMYCLYCSYYCSLKLDMLMVSNNIVIPIYRTYWFPRDI